MLPDILKAAELYAEGLAHVIARRDQWLKKHDELKDHLKAIADHLNNNTTYKQGFFIDSLHAYIEDINGTCTEMPSLTFRSGDMPMLMSFHNSTGERREYVEEGFRITFNPMVTGEILVMLLPHRSELNTAKTQYHTLALIREPGDFTMDMAEEIIARGLEAAFRTSFTGISEQADEEENQARNPIGFKRYETTEKVK